VTKYLFDRPGVSPEDVPVIVTTALRPATFFPVLDQDCLVEVSLPLEFTRA